MRPSPLLRSGFETGCHSGLVYDVRTPNANSEPMSASLYLAPAGGGKTAYLVARARRMSRDPAGAPRVIVATRLQARAWRDRLAGEGGALGVRVGTFDDVSAEVLRAANIVVTGLSDPVQVRLLRSIVATADLAYYAPLRSSPGFVQILRDLFAELKSGGIFPDRLGHAVEAMGGHPRLAELVTLYNAYQVRLQTEGWADYAGIGWLAAEAMQERVDLRLGWPCVMVDGFDDLTEVQITLLEGLAGRVDDLTITLTGCVTGAQRPLAHQRFLETRRTLEHRLGVEARALQASGTATDLLTLAGPTLAPVLRHLERTLFSTTDAVVPPDGVVGMVAAPGRDGEVRVALRWAKQQLVGEEVAPGEVAVLARDVEPYRDQLVETASEFGLPLRFASGQPLRTNPAVTALLDLCRLSAGPTQGLPWRETLAVWRSPYFDWMLAAAPQGSVIGDEAGGAIGISPRDAAALELVARWGRVIGGLDQWAEAFDLLQGAPHESSAALREDGPRLPTGLPVGSEAATLWRRFRAFVTRITAPSAARTYADHVAWLEAMIGDAGSRDDGPPHTDLGLASRACTPDALGARDEAALGALKDVLRGLVMAEAAVQTAPVTFGVFLADLLAAVDTATYRLPDLSEGASILVADVHQVRGLGFRAVALLGVAEGEFPADQAEDPLLRDADRRTLREVYDLPLDLSTTSLEAQAFYEAITRAREALLITRPRIAENGALWQPSPFWDEVLRRISVQPRVLASTVRPSPDSAASWPELLEAAAADAGASPDAEASETLWAWVVARARDRADHVDRARDVLAQRLGQETGPCDGDLMPWHRDFSETYGPSHTWSASRLEGYRSCPFFFFAGSVLRLEPRIEPTEGLDARQLGNIYHHILEKLTERAGAEVDLSALLAVLPEVAGEVLDAAPRLEQFRATAWWLQTRQEIVADVARSLRELDALPGDYVFHAAEQTFGIADRPGEALVLDGGGDSLRLRGFIDRVDRAGDGTVRIIDYKTAGPSAFTNRAVNDGKKLQLPLYALAAQDALELGPVSEGFYWHVRQAKPSGFTLARYRGDAGTGPEAAMATATAMAWQAVRGARAGYFVPKPPVGGCPSYCPAAAFCWHYAGPGWG